MSGAPIAAHGRCWRQQIFRHLLRRNAEIEKELDDEAPTFRAPSLELAPLATADAAWDLFQLGAGQMRARLEAGAGPAEGVALAPSAGEGGAPLARLEFDAWLKRDPRHADPLMVLAFGLNLLHDPGAHGLGRTEIMECLVRRECARIEMKLPDFSPAKKAGALLLKALPALAGRFSRAVIKLRTSKYARLPLPDLHRFAFHAEEHGGTAFMCAKLARSCLAHAKMGCFTVYGPVLQIRGDRAAQPTLKREAAHEVCQQRRSRLCCRFHAPVAALRPPDGHVCAAPRQYPQPEPHCDNQ